MSLAGSEDNFLIEACKSLSSAMKIAESFFVNPIANFLDIARDILSIWLSSDSDSVMNNSHSVSRIFVAEVMLPSSS